ncbi:MAG: HEAT repeat domain-containing protein [Spirochaetaceae bacterium]|nr:HEAT repeat domain-containing protein [Spirochaetaceae bacterium]
MRKYLFTILVICSILTSLPASDASEVWSRLYGRVTSLEQKYTIMQKIIVMDDPSMEFMLINALDELVQGEFYNYTQGQSFELWQDLTIMIIRELGQIKAQDAAPNIRTVMRDYEGLLKSEAMIALGSMGAVEYTEDIATVLRNLNYNTDTDRDRAEIEAYGAIVGLRRMGQIEGFESVFYSHLGWYSRKIKDLASQTLIEMVNDPSDEILSIMDSASFGEKNIALDV